MSVVRLQIPLELYAYLHPAQPFYYEPCGAPRKTEPVSARREENAGKYGSNNGILVVYDEVGNPFVVPIQELIRVGISYDETRDMLRKAEFRKACVYVPHSNDGGAWVMAMWPEVFAKESV